MKTSFRRILVLMAMTAALVTGLAFAQNTVLTGYNLGGPSLTAAPKGSSAGLAVVGDPTAVRKLTVVVSDVRDAGTGDSLDVVSVVREEAWCYNASTLSPDAGGGWERVPALDLYLDAGAVSGVDDDGVPQGVQGSVSLSEGLPCSRIYYNTATLNLATDAGTGLVHRVTLIQTN